MRQIIRETRCITRFAPALCLLIALALLSGGCASTPAPINKADFERLNQASAIHAYYHSPTGLVVMTPGKALAGGGGAIGGLISYGLGNRAGEKLVAEHGLQDPAAFVMENFLASFQSSFPGKVTTSEAGPLDKKVVEKMKAESDGRWLLEFATLNWSLIYFPTDWSHYRILYQGQASLYDPARREPVWFGKCKIEDDLEKQASLEDLTGNNAALLKERLGKTSQTCAETLWQQFLGEKKKE